jgi:hypothetical protein
MPTDGFPIPDLLLRAAYLQVAKERKCYREKFTARTEHIDAVKRILGPEFAHVPADDIRDRIITCCKSPERHGGGWSGTVNGHGPAKVVKNVSPEYLDYLKSPKWHEFRMELIEKFGGRCAICNSGDPLEVHHRHYDRLFREEHFDCIPVCPKCHKVCDARRQRQSGSTPEPPLPGF